MQKVIIVGGGAAGMIAAISAAQVGNKVILLEKNEKLGKKLFITGKGRCNVTNASEIDILFKNVMTNSKFLYSAFYTFDNQAIMALLEEGGCPLKVERGNRVFPVSDHSSDVIAALSKLLKKYNVEILYHKTVKELLWDAQENCITGVLMNDGTRLSASRVIITTGGKSYETTGSTGDGYTMEIGRAHV